MLAALLAVAANYGSKRDNEAGQAVRAVAANAIEAFNFLSTVNSKYDVTGELQKKTVMGEVTAGAEGRGGSETLAVESRFFFPEKRDGTYKLIG